ncbi:hypothetical protein CRENBAI_001506 [Crenichthys baileyi]|uniref:Uncharacterized protein n=1 Tax=Crenichthys baileyi TaxID=28760 RepID=A0AAV9QQ64_9TELE
MTPNQQLLLPVNVRNDYIDVLKLSEVYQSAVRKITHEYKIYQTAVDFQYFKSDCAMLKEITNNPRAPSRNPQASVIPLSVNLLDRKAARSDTSGRADGENVF